MLRGVAWSAKIKFPYGIEAEDNTQGQPEIDANA